MPRFALGTTSPGQWRTADSDPKSLVTMLAEAASASQIFMTELWVNLTTEDHSYPNCHIHYRS